KMKKISELTSTSPVTAYNLLAPFTETTPSEAKRTIEALDCVIRAGNNILAKKVKEESRLWEDLERKSQRSSKKS
ncbi:MAG: hypothetical protein K5776_03675, partial [Lachnospiraceae bacterium]|nr:hypothetical protein [Lachnospiraceae bacterium]